MNVIPRLVFVLALVIVPAVVYATCAGLPPRVATHFGHGGYANGYMSRDGYLAFMLALTTLVPLVVVAMVGFVPRIAASNIKGPQRAYWLAPERRAASLAWIANHACWMGVTLAGLLLGMHLLTVQANLVTPPRLAETAFVPLLGVFLAAIVAWIAIMVAHFRRTR
jgi:uncharacterized membrane protein